MANTIRFSLPKAVRRYAAPVCFYARQNSHKDRRVGRSGCRNAMTDILLEWSDEQDESSEVVSEHEDAG